MVFQNKTIEIDFLLRFFYVVVVQFTVHVFMSESVNAFL